MRLPAVLCALIVALPLAGCSPRKTVAPAATAPILKEDLQHPAAAQGWVGTHLYFGLGPADHPEQGINEADWRAFLDREVTPRFPAGLSVVDVYGQWQGTGAARIERLRSKLLIIIHPDTAENRSKIEAIRAAWKQKTADQSVLLVTEPVDASF